MLRHAPEARWRISSVERKQHFHLLGNETDAFRRLATSARKRFEQRRWQAFVQREAPGRIDMHAITLHAVGAGAVAFKPCNLSVETPSGVDEIERKLLD